MRAAGVSVAAVSVLTVATVLTMILASACAGPARTASPATPRIAAAKSAPAAPPAPVAVPAAEGATARTGEGSRAKMPEAAERAAPEAPVESGPAPEPTLSPQAADAVGAPSPRAARLAWVNPSRCLQPCAFDPGVALRRLDEHGAPDSRGKHRVESTAVAPLGGLLSAARAAGYPIRITSAFRSYRDQTRVFRTMKERGRAARPGHSEHQLGTAIDLRLPTGTAITWLAAHAFEHGFVLSYPAGKQRLTGYRPEPWHVRFVGRELAGELYRRGWTLEDLFRARPEISESGTCADCPAAVSRAACGLVTGAGACQGTVLAWCYDGSLAAVDCAVSDQTCNTATGTTLPDCR